MELYTFIRITNYFDENFVEIMRHTNISNEDFERDLSNIETTNTTNGDHTTNCIHLFYFCYALFIYYMF